jgi:hypothetical protein
VLFISAVVVVLKLIYGLDGINRCADLFLTFEEHKIPVVFIRSDTSVLCGYSFPVERTDPAYALPKFDDYIKALDEVWRGRFDEDAELYSATSCVYVRTSFLPRNSSVLT